MDKFLRELEQASIVIKRRISGSLIGNYNTSALGNSYDFYGIRPYYQGDNIRNIDWKAFGRTEKIYTKLFTEQKQINVTILLDNSKSMDFQDKWTTAKMCTLGISYITLKELNKLNVYSFNEDIQLNLENLNTKGMFYELAKKIDDVKPNGITNFKNIISLTKSNRGVIFIVTDFLSDDYEKLLQNSLSKYEKVIVIHTMCQEELDPKFKGKIKLTDSETKKERIEDIGEKEIELYKKKVKEFIQQCKSKCEKQGVKYIFTPKHSSIINIILNAIEVD